MLKILIFLMLWQASFGSCKDLFNEASPSAGINWLISRINIQPDELEVGTLNQTLYRFIGTELKNPIGKKPAPQEKTLDVVDLLNRDITVISLTQKIKKFAAKINEAFTNWLHGINNLKLKESKEIKEIFGSEKPTEYIDNDLSRYYTNTINAILSLETTRMKIQNSTIDLVKNSHNLSLHTSESQVLNLILEGFELRLKLEKLEVKIGKRSEDLIDQIKDLDTQKDIIDDGVKYEEMQRQYQEITEKLLRFYRYHHYDKTYQTVATENGYEDFSNSDKEIRKEEISIVDSFFNVERNYRQYRDDLRNFVEANIKMRALETTRKDDFNDAMVHINKVPAQNLYEFFKKHQTTYNNVYAYQMFYEKYFSAFAPDSNSLSYYSMNSNINKLRVEGLVALAILVYERNLPLSLNAEIELDLKNMGAIILEASVRVATKLHTSAPAWIVQKISKLFNKDKVLYFASNVKEAMKAAIEENDQKFANGPAKTYLPGETTPEEAAKAFDNLKFLLEGDELQTTTLEEEYENFLTSPSAPRPISCTECTLRMIHHFLELKYNHKIPANLEQSLAQSTPDQAITFFKDHLDQFIKKNLETIENYLASVGSGIDLSVHPLLSIRLWSRSGMKLANQIKQGGPWTSGALLNNIYQATRQKNKLNEVKTPEAVASFLLLANEIGITAWGIFHFFH